MSRNRCLDVSLGLLWIMSLCADFREILGLLPLPWRVNHSTVLRDLLQDVLTVDAGK